MEGHYKGLAVTAAIVAAIGLSRLAMLAALNRRDQAVGLNQEIQYDDFAFSVLGVRKASALGSGDTQTNARGVYHVVTLKIANHAKRVDYTFKKASAILVDDRGREFHLSVDGQQTLESTQSNKCNGPIPAGASCTTEIAFDLPADALPSQMRFSEGDSIGDILDVVFYGKKRIEIGAPQH
ncbi:MAG: DUF4352 domain-containing protein [Acidobacteriota bacterium]